MGGLAIKPRTRDRSVLKDKTHSLLFVVVWGPKSVLVVISCDIRGSNPQSMIFRDQKIPSQAQPRLLEGLKHQNPPSA